MTFNLTAAGEAALDRLPGKDKADRINRALRLAAIVQEFMVAGKLTIVRPDGTPIEVHTL